MAIEASVIENLIREAFPDADVSGKASLIKFSITLASIAIKFN